MIRRCVVIALVALAGCPSEPPPTCATVDLTCAPLYEPTFANVYANTLAEGCGGDRASCHSRRTLSFADPETAYAALLEAHVKPGDASCSEMIVRVVGVGTDYQMPPGDPLDDAEACALVQWVQAGAMR